MELSFEKFRGMNSLLGGFNPDVCGPDTKGIDVVSQFVTAHPSIAIQETIKNDELLLILPFDKFPVNDIEALTCRAPCLVEDCVEHILEPTKGN